MNASEKEWDEMTTEFKNGTKCRQNLGMGRNDDRIQEWGEMSTEFRLVE